MNKLINPTIKALMPFLMAPSMRFVKVQYGGGITGMSGSIAGNTHARNRGGNYMRARTKPTNPNTAEQIAVRQSLAYLMEYWRDTLSSVQRAAWDNYGANVAMTDRLGNTIYHTGMNHFIRSNSICKAHACAIANPGPVVFSLPASDPTLAITSSAGGPTVDITYDDSLPWCSEDNAYMHVFQGLPQNPTVNYFQGPWRYIGSLEGDSIAPVTSPFQFAPTLAVAEGQRLWLYVRFSRADRRLTEKNIADCIVAV